MHCKKTGQDYYGTNHCILHADVTIPPGGFTILLIKKSVEVDHEPLFTQEIEKSIQNDKLLVTLINTDPLSFQL